MVFPATTGHRDHGGSGWWCISYCLNINQWLSYTRFHVFGCLKSIYLQDVTYLVLTGDLRRHRPPWPWWQRMVKSIICSFGVIQS